MDLSTKAIAAISTSVAEEIGKLIGAGEIEDLLALDNGLREILKETGRQAYQKVLEKEDEKLGKEATCECGEETRRISIRSAKFLTVFGWVSYRRSYYGCSVCGKKESSLDTVWRILPGEVSSVMKRLLAISGVEQALFRLKRKLNFGHQKQDTLLARSRNGDNSQMRTLSANEYGLILQ